MWLLDANIDVHLVSVLRGLEISCDTAGQRGWKSLSNGELVRVAVDAGFKCLLTRDQLFGESASEALPSCFAIYRHSSSVGNRQASPYELHASCAGSHVYKRPYSRQFSSASSQQ